ncbi:sensor histidine kinase [Robertmurraya massiliosenegalensis]|uniref:sensor histidine kinase n=1 Tax=Robertmurraya massiliosenegalensis TaxID=1287657 RepID=UPI00030F2249|nr:sensor histidine kinase [Robertmurraya massiliosenegalensis]
MNIIQRQIGWGILVALFVFFVVTLSFILSFPSVGFQELWKRNLMDIPILLFIPSLSLAIGLVFGIVSGLFWKKQFQTLDAALHEVEEGRNLDIDEEGFEDKKAILQRIKKIQRQMSEQVLLSQKLANEKAEDQENRIQEIISQERNRLARELHDSVSQQLFAASMLMSAINETNEHESKQLKMVEGMIHQSQLEMRALLLHLRPVALKGKTLQEGIEELLIELSQKVTMEIHWKVEDFPLNKGVEDHLFRILQESVSNTLRHSKATEVEVLLIKRDGFVILRVVDDGIGFDVEESKAGSYGMQNMYERAVEIGGTLKIISVKNKGTRLEVKVPILKKKDEAND